MSVLFADLQQRQNEAIEFIKGKTNALMKKWTFNLNAAGSQTIDLAGNFIYVYSSTDETSNIDIQISRKDADIDTFNLVKQLGFIHPFDKLHVSWTAQTGHTLTVIIGNLAPELMGIIDNRSPTSQILSDILEELRGNTTAGNFNTVQISSGAGGTQIVAANTDRKSLVIQNMPAGTGNLYLGFDNTLSATKCFACLQPGASWTIDDYRGAVFGLQTVNLDRAAYGEAV